MMICPNCQHTNRQTARFCENCGNSLHPVCPNCGSANRPGSTFCDSCGYQLHREEEPSKAGSPSQPPVSRFIPEALAAKLETARASQAMEGERRVVTMLFCDVKGSTEAAEQLDPEEWADVMNGVFAYMIRPVYQYEGTVARLMGDAILAFFGAPIAHEDDPQRAVLAALDILSGITPYREQISRQWGLDLDVRVGINTGLVMVGAVGSDLQMEYTAMGDAINLAARMEQTAAPGTVQVSPETYQRVAPYFEFDKLGSVQIKGKKEPVQTYRPLRRRAAPGKVRGIAGLVAPLIGRTREIDLLEKYLADLEQGQGGIVFLLGEAGLGKSRLIHEAKMVGSEPPSRAAPTWHETASLSYETGEPYSLFRRLIRRIIGVLPDENPEEMRPKILQLVGEAPEEERATVQRVIESLFGLHGIQGETPMEGGTFRGLLYTVMTSFWERRAKAAPVVLVCDDLHWSDPASMALLQHLYTLAGTVPFLLLCAMRPEPGTPGWEVLQAAERDHPHRHLKIELQPLNSGESGALVDSLLQISELPEALRSRVLAKSEGNPFFVEEMVRSLIDEGVVVRDEDGARWQATGDGADLDIPDNLQSLLVARIDRLAMEVRRTLQVASVVGRSFYYRVVQRLVDYAARDLDQYLVSLQGSALIEESSRIPELEYLFRHALTREAAYSTILLKHRRAIHRRAGEVLEALFPNLLAELASQLAHHFSVGREPEKALAYYTLAGDQAFRLFALDEALVNYDQAIKLAEEAGASDDQLVHLYRRRGRVLELMLRHDEALKTYQTLESLGDERGADALRLAGIAAQGAFYFVGKGDFEKSRLRSEEALVLARKLDDRATEARSLWSLLLAYTWVDSQQALAYGENGLALARELASRPDASNEDLALKAMLLFDLAIPLISRGQIKLARQYTSEAQKVFEAQSNLPMASSALQRLGTAFRLEGRYEEAEEATDQAIAIDTSMGNEGGLIGHATNVLDLYPVVGAFDSLLALVDSVVPIVIRDGKFPVEVFEYYRIVAYYHLGELDLVRQLKEPVIRFKESGMQVYPELYLSYILRAHIQAGELDSAKVLFEKIGTAFDEKNYLIPLNYILPQIQAELAIANGKLEQALAAIDAYMEQVRQVEIQHRVPDMLLIKGQVLRAAGRTEEARTALREAHTLAARQNARTALWQICSQLAEVEEEIDNLDAAQALRLEGRQAIDFIAEHAGREDLRESFLKMPDVQRLVSETSENVGQ